MKRFDKLGLITLIFTLSSCGENFLDIKRNANQVVPSTIADYQAILDNNNVMINVPSFSLGIVGADEYVVSEEVLKGLSIPYQRNGYIWADNVYEGQEASDWNRAYQRILYANMALKAKKIIPKSAEESQARDNVVGTALFFRAQNHYQLAQLFCKPYNSETAEEDHAIPLKLDYDVNVREKPPTIATFYGQIISDLKEAMELLPVESLNTFRPNKATVCALLSRCYLQMDRYDEALDASTMGLGISDGLLNFNILDLSTRYTFPRDNGISNPEVLLSCILAGQAILAEANFNVDPSLYALYDEADLRKRAYFVKNEDGRVLFKGSYSGYPSSNPFVGLTTSEMLLIRAECYARIDRVTEAVADLNRLLLHRFETESFSPIDTKDSFEVLKMILMERRKELFLRGVRWEDLRRLNKDQRFQKTLVREVNGKTYMLPPNHPKWVWPIPEDEIN